MRKRFVIGRSQQRPYPYIAAALAALALAQLLCVATLHAAPPPLDLARDGSRGGEPAEPRRAGTAEASDIIILRGSDDAGAHLALVVPRNVLAQLQQSGSASAVNLSQVGGTSVSSTLYDPANTALKVNCVVGCTASAGFTDNTAFTAGASSISNIGGVFNDALAAVASGNSAAPRITSNRGLHVNFRNAGGSELASSTAAPAGTELGLIVRNIPSGTQSVSGTVTANAGTGTFTVGGTVTSNQGGAPWTQRIQDGLGATLATVTAANALKVDGSAVTQPVSGSVTANAGSGTFTVGGTVTANQGTAAAVAGAWPAKVTDGTNVSAVKAAATTAVAADPSLVVGLSPNSPLPAGTNSIGAVVATQTTAANLNVRDDSNGATGAAVPARAIYIAGNGTGNLTGLRLCDTSVAINTAAAGSTQLVALTAGQTIYVCGYNFMAAGAVNVDLRYGTGTNCATAPVSLTGPYNLVAQTGVSYGNGAGVVVQTAAANALCVNLSAAVQVSGVVSYTKF